MVMFFNRLFESLQSTPFEDLDYLVIIINLATLMMSGLFVGWISNNRPDVIMKKRLVGMIIINVGILLIYLIAGLLSFSLGQKFSQLVLTCIVAYGVNHILQLWILKRFGTEREIGDKKLLSSSYSSSMMGLLVLVIILSLTFVVVLNIWELNSWLQASSFLGAAILILYASKDYLLGDIISSLIFHSNRSLEAGHVIRVKTLDIFGVIQRISFTQTVIRDLVRGIEIVISNSTLRNAVIENFSRHNGSVKDFLDFNVDYSVNREQIEDALIAVWEQAKEEESLITESKANVQLIEHGDHALVWRLNYSIKSPYKILVIQHKIRDIALVLCREKGIELNTPLTHQTKITR